jgi:hypothetical protein
MQIKVQIRTVYGRDTVYPACADARRFADIAGSKTLTDQTLRLVRDLGYEIQIVHPVVTIAA